MIEQYLPKERLDIKIKITGENTRYLSLLQWVKNMKIYVRLFCENVIYITSLSNLVIGIVNGDDLLYIESIN